MQLILESVRDAREAARAIESFLADDIRMHVQPTGHVDQAQRAVAVLVDRLGVLRG